MRFLRLLALFCLLLLITVFASYSGFRSFPDGVWANETPNADIAVPQVRVRRVGAQVFVTAWGSCTPLPCDWGEEVAKLVKGSAVATWDSGYKTTQLQLVPQLNGELRVTIDSNYGRRPHAVQFLSRWIPNQENAASAAARVILRQVAERYRSLPSAYFESLINGTHMKIYLLPPNKGRLEIEDSNVHIEDGQSVWQINVKTNQYSRYPQRTSFPFHFPEYRGLEQILGESRIVGRQLFEGVMCTLIQIESKRTGLVTVQVVSAATGAGKVPQPDGDGSVLRQ
jgi:hypothetical protein